MVNLFTGQVVSGGWPVDWWPADQRPFPLMTAVEIESPLVPQMAVFHERQGREDRLVGMFLQLKDQYGWAMFRKAFRAAIDDGIQWDASGANPSALRTAYVAAYLQIGAAEDISGILGPLVPGYDALAVKDIVRARSTWFALHEESSRHKALKAAFLKGDYKAGPEVSGHGDPQGANRPVNRRRRAWRGSATHTSKRRSATSRRYTARPRTAMLTARHPTPSDRPPATASGSACSGRMPRGGLGAVFVALDAELDREVALKQILANHADDPVSRQQALDRGRDHRRPRTPWDRAGLRPGRVRRWPPPLRDALAC